MLLTQCNQIILSDKRLTAGINIEVNAKLFSLFNNAVNLIKCKDLTYCRTQQPNILYNADYKQMLDREE